MNINVINASLSKVTINFLIIYLIFVIFKYIYFKLESIVSLRFTMAKSIKEQKKLQDLFKITHEVKNPLAVCKGYVDMFDINNKEHSKMDVPIIKSEIDKVLILLKDFL